MRVSAVTAKLFIVQLRPAYSVRIGLIGPTQSARLTRVIK